MRRFRRLRRRVHRWWVRLMWVGVIVVAGGTVAVAATVVAPGLAETDAPGATGGEINTADVEQQFLDRLNDERRDHGQQPLSQRETLTEMGQAHSRNMAQHDYVGHEEPDGTTIADRYRDRGLLPACRLPTSGGEFYPGAENAIRYPLNGVSGESELARGLLTEWMGSPDHRDVLLLASADEAGLGIVIKDGTAYAALELC